MTQHGLLSSTGVEDDAVAALATLVDSCTGPLFFGVDAGGVELLVVPTAAVDAAPVVSPADD